MIEPTRRQVLHAVLREYREPAYAALNHVLGGRAVLALCGPGHGGENCGCPPFNCPACPSYGCKGPGTCRYPSHPDGASLARHKILEWWSRSPRANLGVATGAAFNLIVVETPANPAGMLARLQPEYRTLPQTVTATAGERTYQWFSYSGSAPLPSRGLDAIKGRVVGEDGFVLAPPSRIARGIPFHWLDGHSPYELPLAPLPSWLAEVPQ